MHPMTAPEPESVRTPNLLEIFAVFLLTQLLAMLIGAQTLLRMPGSPYREVASVAAHLPMLLIPWLWYRWRIAPGLAPGRRPLLRWPPRSTRIFLWYALGFGVIKFLAEIPGALSQKPPFWLTFGVGTILLRAGFQGILVGFSEEMHSRVGLHAPLRARLTGTFGRSWYQISHAGVITALLFGLTHIGNLFMGSSLAAAAVQALYAAFIGLLLSWFYEHSDGNYVGCAILHNLHDVAPVVAAVLFTAH